MYGTSDEFHFCYQQVTGDCEIVAQMTAEALDSNNAKAGVIIRNGIAVGNEEYAAVSYVEGRGRRGHYRTTSGGTTTFTTQTAITLPHWFRVARVGNQLTMSYSTDGTTWFQEAQATINTMAATAYVGIFVTSYEDTQPFPAPDVDFDNVAITEAPGAFGLLTPTDTSTDIAPDVTLDWEDATGAESYGVMVDNNADFSSPLVDQTGLATSTYDVAGGTLSPGTVYYWRATAYAGTFPLGTDCNADFSFTTGTAPAAFVLQTPTNMSTGQSLTPTLQWADATGATTYTIQLDDDAGFTSTIVNDATLTESEYAVGAGLLALDTPYYWRVRATNVWGFTDATNNNFQFQTLNTPPPGAFDLLTPTDTATGVSVTATLDWEDATDATTYALLIDDDPAFGSPAVDLSGLGSSQYTLSGSELALATTYYWRVTATNTSGSTQCNLDFSFETEYPPAPGAFSLATPTDTTTDVSLAATLDWGDSSDADTYTLLVDDDAGFGSPEVTDATLTDSTYTIAGGALAYNTTYYWRVSAVNATDTTAASNNDFSFTTVPPPPPGAFTLATPTDAATGVSLTATLDWGDSSDAATYTLLIDDDAGFGSPVVSDATLTDSTYTVAGGVLSYNTTYYWSVSAVNVTDTTAASNNDFSFTTVPPPAPGAFTLATPADTATGVSLTATLDWGDSSDADTYTLLVDNDPGFGSPEVNDATLTSSTYTVGAGVLSPGTTYHWRVSSVNVTATTAASNNDFSFETALTPGAFDLLTPANNAVDVDVTPTLDWGDASNTDTYTLLVDDDAGFASPEVSESSLASSTYDVPASVLDVGTTYYWRVTAVNVPGSTAATNNDFSFVTTTGVAPGAFSLTSPAADEREVSTTATLDWEDASGAASYALQVDDDAGFASPEVDESSLTSSTYTVGAAVLSSATVYYWRVTATNQNGTTNASNNGISFGTAPVAQPAPFTISAPLDGATGLVADIDVDWGDSSNLPVFTLVLYSDAAMTNAVLIVDDLTSSHHTIPMSSLSSDTTYYIAVTADNSDSFPDTDAINNGVSFTTGTLAIAFLGEGCASAGPGAAGVWLVACALVWGILSMRRGRGVPGG